ncbi:MAG: MBL fold metallo-hydrolase [Candidatus Micrarchaeia archaeon]
MARLAFIGHSSFELELDGTLILFDPFFGQTIAGRPRALPPAREEADIKRCDLILVSHEHDDHCDKAAVEAIAQRTGAVVVGPKPALARLELPERFKVDVRTGDKFEVKGVEIEVVKALHPQSAYPVGFVVRKGGKSVYHAGDTYEYREMADIACDVAILPVGGSYTMDALEAGKAIWGMRCGFVVPMHYDTFDWIAQPELKSWAKGQKKRVIILRSGQTVEF